MLRKPKKGIAPALMIGVAALLMAAGVMAAWMLSGYSSLLPLGLMMLMPAVLNLLLLLPFGREPGEKTKALGRFWFRKRGTVIGLLMVAVLFVCNYFFWTAPTGSGEEHRLNYLYPVILAVLFTLSVILEKWCAHAAAKEACDGCRAIILQNLQGALAFGRMGLLLTAASMVLALTGIYDPCRILEIVLSVLFIYETVMLVLSFGIRLIRKELEKAPLMPLSLKQLGNSNLLGYLEENTGITMRSLWSIRLVKRIVPGFLMLVLLLCWLATGVIQIESHQQGAVYRFGKLLEEPLEPGIHMTLPLPFDRVEVYDTETVRKVEVGYVSNGTQDNIWTEGHGGEEYRLLLGGGNEIVSINLRVEYVIGDLTRYVRCCADPGLLLRAAAYEIVTERTIVTDIDTLLAADREVFSETFREELTTRLEAYDTGVEITNVVLESIHPPVEIAYIYQQIISAGTRAEQLILEAERSAEMEVYNAKNMANSEISLAQTSYYQQVAAANGAVAEFMAAKEADENHHGAYRYYKYMNALTQTYQKGVLIIAGEGVDTTKLIIGNLSAPVEEDPYYQEPEVDEDF